MNDWNNLTNDISLQSGISTPVYGILVATGLICSLLFMIYEWKKLNGSIKIFGWLFFIGSFSGIVGSRWIYLILNASDIYKFLSIWIW